MTSAAGKLRLGSSSLTVFVPNPKMLDSTLVGVVLGGAVRGGTKALQRLTAQERLQDLHAASQHLEATASGGTPQFVICLVRHVTSNMRAHIHQPNAHLTKPADSRTAAAHLGLHLTPVACSQDWRSDPG